MNGDFDQSDETSRQFTELDPPPNEQTQLRSSGALVSCKGEVGDVG
jgi:hypothetical protein